MADITLSASVRSNLLSLGKTTDLINKTQTRLATGLSVASPIDDAVAYFQSKALNDRAADFEEKKSGIDQGISTLKTALTAVDAIDKMVKQMKGLVLSAKSATDTEKGDLQEQFNDLAVQINELANDASYQGLNLVNSTAAKLTVNFSETSTAKLEVEGVELNASILLTAAGGAASVIASLLVGDDWSDIGASEVSDFEAAIDELDNALTTLRGNAKTLGSNVAVLQTRLDFTKSYSNNLTEGAGKLNLADLNEEGANLVALQTRQQLGMQALQFAGTAEQAVLQLFR